MIHQILEATTILTQGETKKVSVLTNNPEWVPWTKFPYKMLQKWYQALLVFSDPAVANTFFDDLKKEYQNGFYVHITEERTDLKLTAAYIGGYARRPPLSELRIKSYTGEDLSFEFKNYTDKGSKVL